MERNVHNIIGVVFFGPCSVLLMTIYHTHTGRVQIRELEVCGVER